MSLGNSLSRMTSSEKIIFSAPRASARRSGPEDSDGRAAPNRAFDFEMPSGRLDDLADRREAQARPLIALGGEVRLEEMGLHFLAHSRAGVGHVDRDLRNAVRHFPQAQRQPSAVAHGVAGSARAGG